MIAAYGADGKILWSWHVWVTDYQPDATGDATVLEPENKRKLKFTFQVSQPQLPMMDRNLGAMAGYTKVPPLQKSASGHMVSSTNGGVKSRFQVVTRIVTSQAFHCPQLRSLPLSQVS